MNPVSKFLWRLISSTWRHFRKAFSSNHDPVKTAQDEALCPQSNLCVMLYPGIDVGTGAAVHRYIKCPCQRGRCSLMATDLMTRFSCDSRRASNCAATLSQCNIARVICWCRLRAKECYICHGTERELHLYMPCTASLIRSCQRRSQTLSRCHFEDHTRCFSMRQETGRTRTKYEICSH